MRLVRRGGGDDDDEKQYSFVRIGVAMLCEETENGVFMAWDGWYRLSIEYGRPNAASEVFGTGRDEKHFYDYGG